MFGPELHKRIIDAATEAHPKELCALVVDGGLVVMENVADDPEKTWKIDTADMLRETNGRTLQAVVHSHPDGINHPSYNDSKNQIAHNVPWGITARHTVMGVYQQPFFWGDGVPVAPLQGRQFRFGVHDCFSLVRDWFHLTHGIRFPNVARDSDWWTRGENLFLDHFSGGGFEMLVEHPNREDFAKLKEGDCVIGRIMGAVSNHCGVYIGRGLVLHHLPKRLSRPEPIGPWMRRITHIFRHKELMDNA